MVVESKERNEPLVDIVVDEVDKAVRPGKWLVSELKNAVGVDPSKALAEITPQGLKDLADDAKIAVHPHQKFMSHVRGGASS